MSTTTMVASAAGRTMMRISCCLSRAERLLALEGQLAGVLGGKDCEGGIVLAEVVMVSVGSVPEGMLL